MAELSYSSTPHTRNQLDLSVDNPNNDIKLSGLTHAVAARSPQDCSHVHRAGGKTHRLRAPSITPVVTVVDASSIPPHRSETSPLIHIIGDQKIEISRRWQMQKAADSLIGSAFRIEPQHIGTSFMKGWPQFCSGAS